MRLRSLPAEAPGQLAEIRIADMRGARGNFSIWHAGATNAIWEEICALAGTLAGAWLADGLSKLALGFIGGFLESERAAQTKTQS